MRNLFVLSVVLFFLLQCDDPKEKILPGCNPQSSSEVCNEDASQRSIEFDCIQPDNDSIFWVVMEVQADIETHDHLFDSSEQFVEFLLTNGDAIYTRNSSCLEMCDTELCQGDFFSAPITELTSLRDGFFISYNKPGERITEINCSTPIENTFRFIIASDPNETKIIGRDELLNFLGEVDTYSEAIIHARMNRIFVNDPITEQFRDLNKLTYNNGGFVFEYYHTDYVINRESDTCQIKYLYRTHQLIAESGNFQEPQDSLIDEKLGFEASSACIPCAPFH